MATDLSRFNNIDYHPGPSWKRLLWYFSNIVFLNNSFSVISSLKVIVLRIFGAKIGKGVVIKPCVNIKYPWLLVVGDYCWIGENVWIDNLASVTLGNHVCISQGSMLLTGNHNYKSPVFDLIVESIILEDGVWLGAKSVVCPGVIARSHAVLSVGSIASKELEAYSIYQGNPAEKVRKRIFTDSLD